MNATRWYFLAPSPVAALLRGSLALGLVLGTACDIDVTDNSNNDGAGTDGDADDGNDDDDNDGNEGGNDGGNDDPDGGNDDPDGGNDDTDPDDTDDGGADDPSGGAEGDPEEGTWVYTETGRTTNSCDFLGNPSNGWGSYEVIATGPGQWQIVPGDDTDPFECETDGGGFSCAERLQDEITQGTSTIQVLVSIDGQLDSSTSMSGVQHGVADCSGPECPLAEQLLETSFPCSFDIPFNGDRA